MVQDGSFLHEVTAMVALKVEVEEVLKRVESWPAATRLVFARRVLETLDHEPEEALKRRGAPVEEILGLLATGGPVPNDEECQRILEEELLKKYAR
jgi:hypothetical protein